MSEVLHESARPLTPAVKLRTPAPEDAADIWRLVDQTKNLDTNSAYAYAVIADYFGESCVVAELGDEVVGFVTGFRPPKKEDAVFLWQVAVSPKARGRGLGKRLLRRFAEKNRGAVWLETTISPSNEASEALFRGFARDIGAGVRVCDGYSDSLFPDAHESERLFQIGPLPGAITKKN